MLTHIGQINAVEEAVGWQRDSSKSKGCGEDIIRRCDLRRHNLMQVEYDSIVTTYCCWYTYTSWDLAGPADYGRNTYASLPIWTIISLMDKVNLKPSCRFATLQ